MFKQIAIATGLLMASGALAAGAAPQEQKAPTIKPGSAKDPSRKVCRNLLPTGSRMSQRVCKTQKQWDEDAAFVQDRMRDSDLNGSRRDGEFNGQGRI